MRRRRWTSAACCHELLHGIAFYIAAAVAIIATVLVITRLKPSMRCFT